MPDEVSGRVSSVGGDDSRFETMVWGRRVGGKEEDKINNNNHTHTHTRVRR